MGDMCPGWEVACEPRLLDQGLESVLVQEPPCAAGSSPGRTRGTSQCRMGRQAPSRDEGTLPGSGSLPDLSYSSFCLFLK